MVSLRQYWHDDPAPVTLTRREQTAHEGAGTFLSVDRAERISDVADAVQGCRRILHPALYDVCPRENAYKYAGFH